MDRIGFVVIGRNEGQRLVACLRSVLKTECVVIYVDSASTDGSERAAAKMGAHVVQLDMTKPITAARARNAGFWALKHKSPSVEFVHFIDGDCEIADGWLPRALDSLMTLTDVAVVCGRRREKFPSASLYNALCDLEWAGPIGSVRACGGDALVRVAAFEEVGGYSDFLIAGEDPEFCVRLRGAKWKILRIDAEMTSHDANILKFSRWWLRVVRSGHAYAEVRELHRHSPRGIYCQETTRAILWGGAIPLAAAAGVFVSYYSALALLLYPLQVVRIAFRSRPLQSLSWLYAGMVTLGKIAEFQGITKFYLSKMRRRRSSLIEYK